MCSVCTNYFVFESTYFTHFAYINIINRAIGFNVIKKKKKLFYSRSSTVNFFFLRIGNPRDKKIFSHVH